MFRATRLPLTRPRLSLVKETKMRLALYCFSLVCVLGLMVGTAATSPAPVPTPYAHHITGIHGPTGDISASTTTAGDYATCSITFYDATGQKIYDQTSPHFAFVDVPRGYTHTPIPPNAILAKVSTTAHQGTTSVTYTTWTEV